MTELCHCGRPLHYTSRQIEEIVRRYVKKLGEHVTVIGSDGRRWKVQRHYLALHGLKDTDVSMLGFEEVVIPEQLRPQRAQTQ